MNTLAEVNVIRNMRMCNHERIALIFNLSKRDMRFVYNYKCSGCSMCLCIVAYQPLCYKDKRICTCVAKNRGSEAHC